MSFERIEPRELDGNVFRQIGHDWLLICLEDKKHERCNLMTASWGGMGVLWNKEVCFLFVRPQRYTHDLLEQCDRFAVAILPESLRSAHKICGAESGRDVDKIKKTGLTTAVFDGVCAPSEAELVMVLKTLYVDQLKENAVCNDAVLSHYPQKDYHTVYVCEIEAVMKRLG